MKNLILALFAIALLAACNPVPNKSIFEELTTEELASIIKSEPEFAEAYERRLSIMINNLHSAGECSACE